MDLYTLQMSLAWRARTFDGPSAVEVDKKASQSEEETNGKGLSHPARIPQQAPDPALLLEKSGEKARRQTWGRGPRAIDAIRLPK